MKIRNIARMAILNASFYLLTNCGGPGSENHFYSSEKQKEYSLLAQHESAERDYHPSYIHDATGKPEFGNTKLDAERYDWPFALQSIGHTNASYQNYGGDPYFHHGLDIRGPAGTPVLASVGGKVINIENYGPGPAYWEVAILDDHGFIWQYHHVDRQSIPPQILDAHRTGAPIAKGAKLGEIYYWPIVTFGERYHHVHLNVLGEGGVYLSPFEFLKPLEDSAAPRFVAVGLMKDGHPVLGSQVSGHYSIYATIHDLILHEQFVVPPHQISVLIDGGTESNVWEFSTLPGGSSNTKYVEDFFVPALTCGDYECRKLSVDLGFVKDSHRTFPAQRGSHSIKIIAKDYAGNIATKDFTWTVR